MSNSEFIQQSAYIYQPTQDELELMRQMIIVQSESDETDTTDNIDSHDIVIIDILGE